jgi:uncharacterized membrane protein
MKGISQSDSFNETTSLEITDPFASVSSVLSGFIVVVLARRFQVRASRHRRAIEPTSTVLIVLLAAIVLKEPLTKVKLLAVGLTKPDPRG